VIPRRMPCWASVDGRKAHRPCRFRSQRSRPREENRNARVPTRIANGRVLPWRYTQSRETARRRAVSLTSNSSSPSPVGPFAMRSVVAVHVERAARIPATRSTRTGTSSEGTSPARAGSATSVESHSAGACDLGSSWTLADVTALRVCARLVPRWKHRGLLARRIRGKRRFSLRFR
jgi:hypothetical protein